MYLIFLILYSSIFLKIQLMFIFFLSVYNVSLILKYYFYFSFQNMKGQELVLYLQDHKIKRLNLEDSLYSMLYHKIFDYYIDHLWQGLEALNENFLIEVEEILNQKIKDIEKFKLIIFISIFNILLSLFLFWFENLGIPFEFLRFSIILIFLFFLQLILLAFIAYYYFFKKIIKLKKDLDNFQLIVIEKISKLSSK